MNSVARFVSLFKRHQISSMAALNSVFGEGGYLADVAEMGLTRLIPYISGIIEIVLALLILWSVTRSWAGWGLIALTIAVTPANIYMYMNPLLFPDGTETDYLIRLFVQVFLLVLIWRSTRTSPQTIEEGSSVS